MMLERSIWGSCERTKSKFIYMYTYIYIYIYNRTDYRKAHLGRSGNKSTRLCSHVFMEFVWETRGLPCLHGSNWDVIHYNPPFPIYNLSWISHHLSASSRERSIKRTCCSARFSAWCRLWTRSWEKFEPTPWLCSALIGKGSKACPCQTKQESRDD